MYLVSHYHPQDKSIDLGAYQGLSEALEGVVNRIAITLHPDAPTSTHVTVRSGRSDYSSAYMRDERPFEYGASDTQAMQFINQFITTMVDLGM